MNVALCPGTRRLLTESHAPDEVRAFIEWLSAERYTDFVVDLHARRLLYILPRLPQSAPAATYKAAQLIAVFGRERKPRSRFHGFAATRRVYERFLRLSGRLIDEPRGPYADLCAQYERYLLEVRGLSPSARTHHGLTVRGLLGRGLRRRQPLGADA